jgi:hypothetical protein
MKSALTLLAALLLTGTAASAQKTIAMKPVQAAKPAAGKAAASPLKWKKTEHQFGEIKQGVPVTASFSFTNTTKKPVLLVNAFGSCGCTVPSWSKDPILPGKSSVITATFNAANPGAFNKTVTVTSNADTNGPQVLTLSGTVVPSATAEAKK